MFKVLMSYDILPNKKKSPNYDYAGNVSNFIIILQT